MDIPEAIVEVRFVNKTDRKNQLITYAYDGLNQLTQKSYPDSTTVNYTYDLDSRLTQVPDTSPGPIRRTQSWNSGLMPKFTNSSLRTVRETCQGLF